MILTREQIDAATGRMTWPETQDLIATARAYHDLRDAVLAQVEAWDWSEVTPTIKAIVARVDGSGNGAGAVADGAT